MELIVAILIALGSMTQSTVFNDEYVNRHQEEISKVKTIIDNGQYRTKDGGVIIDAGGGI